MLRALFLSGIFLFFLVAGLVAPFVFSLGYVWVSTFRPQSVDSMVLQAIPVSVIMGAGAIGSYLLLDRRSPPPVTATTVLTLLLAVWTTFTLLWAVVPGAAWTKWDWAFKTLLFSAFMPLVFRTRVQIEAMLQVWMFSLGIYFLPFGFKTLISGGGYGKYLGIVSGNSGLTESSTLAAVSLMAVPLILFLRTQSVLLTRSRLTDALYIGLAVAALAAAVGSYARTGLVGMLVVGVGLLLRSRHKILYGALGAAAALAIILFSSQAWNERIASIDDYEQEASALGRLLVWQWTVDFAVQNPLGGGFNAYMISQIEMGTLPGTGEPRIIIGKAFHNIYIEVLGEHGWIGLGLYLALLGTTLLTQQRLLRRTRGRPELEWCNELARALQIALVTIMACGMFIGIAFQPMIYYLIAITASVANHVRRVDAPSPARVAVPTLGAGGPEPALPGARRWSRP
ncbi:putative O-glycosylation ligase, exosortase A system-associated [Roseomonas sp. BN140053]|uniref:putative O-glycosylation ligase, exosortase A system-associated n=1 Tax=Roseomonas sp. BN140053 TaxID=3391898 RepID=UPI0039E94192